MKEGQEERNAVEEEWRRGERTTDGFIAKQEMPREGKSGQTDGRSNINVVSGDLLYFGETLPGKQVQRPKTRNCESHASPETPSTN